MVKKKMHAIMVFMLALCLMSTPVTALATETGDANSGEYVQEDGWHGDDTWQGDDGTAPEKEQIGTGDYYNEFGSPFQSGTLAAEEYKNWTQPVIVETVETSVTVNDNNKYDVVKKVKAFLNTDANHKVVMAIPLNNFMPTSSDDVENVAVTSTLAGTSFKTQKTAGYFNVVITDSTAGRTHVEYEIKYTYVSRGDEASDCDVFAHDMICFKDYPVKQVNFKINMPKAYEQQNLYFEDFSGSTLNMLGSSENLTLSGNYSTTLQNGYLKTVLVIQDDYFDSTSSSGLFRFVLGFISFLSIIAVFGGFALAAWSYYQFGRSENPEIIPQTKPIAGLTPVDIIVALSGGCTNEDLMLYLLQLANEGYIRIESKIYKHAKKKDPTTGYTIIKVKDYDGKDKYMKEFMRILFKNGDRVRPKDLSGKIYKDIDRLRLRIQDTGIDELWEIDDTRRKICSNAGLLIPLLVSLSMSLYNFDVGFGVHTLSFFYGPLMAVGIYIAIRYIDNLIKKRNMMRGGVADTMTWIYVFGSAFLIIMFSGSLNGTMFIKNPLTITLSYIAEVVLIYCSCSMKKRTEEGVELCGKILGFRQFLLESDEVSIKRHVLKDEQYLYKTLPLAVALDVATEGWMASMDNCHIDDPTWYHAESETEFRMVDFMSDWPAIVESALEKPNDEEDD